MATLKIFFHDNCFDGTASAALFASFYQACIEPGVEIRYQGVQHGNGDPFKGLSFDGDDNACVDFRYSTSERLTWWFDHHVTAFQPPDTRAHFEADDSGQKFFDPTAFSCTSFQARVLAEKYGYEVPQPFSEIIHWADVIDSARFESPASAVMLTTPATQLMTWVRHNRDSGLTHRYIDHLRVQSLAEVAAEPWVTGLLTPIVELHQRTMEIIQRRAVCGDHVVFFDLTDESVSAYNSFIPYYLFPDARYTVGMIRAEGMIRISVGFNPWSPFERGHHIASICERFGGGGHSAVGGIAVADDDIARGREITAIICRELSE